MNCNRSLLSKLQSVYNQSESNAQSLGCLVYSGCRINELKVCVCGMLYQYSHSDSIQLPSPPLGAPEPGIDGKSITHNKRAQWGGGPTCPSTQIERTFRERFFELSVFAPERAR
jgi:hypothetical protein